MPGIPLDEATEPLARQSTDELDDQFRELVKAWKSERRATSTAKRMAEHPAYRAIIAMGKPAVPLIVAEMEREPDHWFTALHEITGASPVPDEDRGNIEKMTKAWADWLRKESQ